MRVALKLALLAGATALGLSAAGSAQADPWIGKWKSVDTDGSNQTLTIAKKADGAYDVLLHDDRASACGGIAANGVGVGNVSGNTMTGTTTITCADGRVLGTFPFKGTYNAAGDTFTDGLGVVWSRVKDPAPPKAKPLPLGRLVLSAADAPGLKARVAKPASARRAMAGALRPAKLPRFAAKETQVAHFTRGSTTLWSIAFVTKSAAAAKTAALALQKAGRGARIAIGSSGSVLHRGKATVVWYRGRVVGAVVFVAPFSTAGDRGVAIGYARSADARIARALSTTAWTHTLHRIGPKGRLTRKIALDLFALAYGPLPGTKLPAGRAGRIDDGSPAQIAILHNWRALTVSQRAAAATLLGAVGIGKRPARSVVGSGRLSHPLRGAIVGDPLFTEDDALEATAEQYADYYAAKLGVKRTLRMVAGTTTAPMKASADAATVDDFGFEFNNLAKYCRIRIGPKGQQESSASGERRLFLVAHEVFHCMQFEIAGYDAWPNRKAGLWLWEGSADWAASRLLKSWTQAWSFRDYLNSCQETPLFARSYDGSGFFGHSDDSVGSFWSRARATIKAQAAGDLGAYYAAGGFQGELISTWASSPLVGPQFGTSWVMYSPLTPPSGGGCPTKPVAGSATLTSLPLATGLYFIEPAVRELELPLMHVDVAKGRGRISDGALDENIDDAWYWIGDKNQEPKCPDDADGSPPPAPPIGLPAVVGLAAGTVPGAGSVTFASLEQFCKQKQKGIPIVPIPPDKGGGKGVKCHSKCGHSFGDPHLIPFDGLAYDFMATGEFTLVRSTTGDLEIQVRNQPYPGSKYVSVTVTVATRLTGNRVVVEKGSPLRIRVNGQSLIVPRSGVRLKGDGMLRSVAPELKGLPGQLELAWPDGTVARVWSVSEEGLTLLVKPSAAREGKLVGLLGNADGRKTNDYATRGGRKISPAVLKPGTMGRSYRALYRLYGDSWRVTRQTSLFDYAPGETTATFTDRRFPARAPGSLLSKADKARLARARRVCERIKDPDVFAGCLVDVVTTGDFSFAAAAARVDRTAGGRSKPKAPPPPPPPPPPPSATSARATLSYDGKTTTYVARKGSTDGCELDNVGGIAFRLTIGTLNPGDSRPIFDLDAGFLAKKDGTYKNRMLTFEVGGALRQSLDLTVTLAGKRTRGTFSGTAQGSRVSGSFSC